MNCFLCGHYSVKMEVCPDCAPVLWPHRVINPAAKQLATTLMPVPPLGLVGAAKHG